MSETSEGRFLGPKADAGMGMVLAPGKESLFNGTGNIYCPWGHGEEELVLGSEPKLLCL